MKKPGYPISKFISNCGCMEKAAPIFSPERLFNVGNATEKTDHSIIKYMPVFLSPVKIHH